MRWLTLVLAALLIGPITLAQPFPPELHWDGEALRNGSQQYYGTHKFGFNLDVDTTTDPELIWSVGGTYTYLTSADTLYVVSASADDDSTGTGARTLVIEGLDGNYNKITATAYLNGTTEDTVKTAFLRVYRAYITSAGSGGTNAGAITITDDAATSTLAVIPAGYGQTQMAMYTTRANHVAWITGWNACTEKNAPATDATFRLRMRDAVNGGWRVLDEVTVDTAVNPCEKVEYTAPVRVPARADIELVLQETGADNLLVHGDFKVWEVK